MRNIYARNVNDALPLGMQLLQDQGVKRDSRNGGVVLSPMPVTTMYAEPQERVIFDEKRDANPYFHLLEAMWMLAGRNDVAFPAHYAKQLMMYSDDGTSLNGAYGHRWRVHFEFDQLLWAIDRIRQNKDDRRVVIQMWDANQDIEWAINGGKDVPCNTQLYVWVDVRDRLCITVCNRSNDIIWGAYGANAVHFSVLQEFIAQACGLEVGPYWQISNNYHAYVDLFDKLKSIPDEFDVFQHDPYEMGQVKAMRLVTGKDNYGVFLSELQMLLSEGPMLGLRVPFLKKIVSPMMQSHAAYKEKDWEAAHEALKAMPAENDWRRACEEWLERRLQNAKSKQG